MYSSVVAVEGERLKMTSSWVETNEQEIIAVNLDEE